MRQRSAVIGLGILTALAFAATACTAAPAAPAPTTSSKSGMEVLAVAASKTKGQSYQFAVTYGTALTGEGVASGDGAATSMKVTLADAVSGVLIKINALVLKDAAYAKLDLGPAGAIVNISPTTWIHIDPAKAPGAARLGISPGTDIFGPDTYVKAVQTAKVDSNTQISGVIDLTKTALPGLSATSLAGGPTTLPFTASLDSQGRISKIVVKVPSLGQAVPAADLTTTYSNWGTQVDSTPPPTAETVEAPPIVYTFLQ
jgi:hypothetical protein